MNRMFKKLGRAKTGSTTKRSWNRKKRTSNSDTHHRSLSISGAETLQIMNPVHLQKKVSMSSFQSTVLGEWIHHWVAILRTLPRNMLTQLLVETLHTQGLVQVYRLYLLEQEPSFHVHLQFCMAVLELEQKVFARSETLRKHALDIHRRTKVYRDQSQDFKLPSETCRKLEQIFASDSRIDCQVFAEAKAFVLDDLANHSQFLRFFESSFFDAWLKSATAPTEFRAADEFLDLSDPFVLVFLTTLQLLPVPVLLIDVWAEGVPEIGFANRVYLQEVALEQVMGSEPPKKMSEIADLAFENSYFVSDAFVAKSLCIGETCRNCALVFCTALTEDFQGLGQVVEHLPTFWPSQLNLADDEDEKNAQIPTPEIAKDENLIQLFASVVGADPVHWLETFLELKEFRKLFFTYLESIQLHSSLVFWETCRAFANSSKHNQVSAHARFLMAKDIYLQFISPEASTPVSILYPLVLQYMEVFSQDLGTFPQSKKSSATKETERNSRMDQIPTQHEQEFVNADFFQDSQNYVLESMATNCLPQFSGSPQFAQFLYEFCSAKSLGPTCSALSSARAFPLLPLPLLSFFRLFLTLWELCRLPVCILHGPNRQLIYANPALAQHTQTPVRKLLSRSLSEILDIHLSPQDRLLSTQYANHTSHATIMRPMLLFPHLDQTFVCIIAPHSIQNTALEKAFHSVHNSLSSLPCYIHPPVSDSIAKTLSNNTLISPPNILEQCKLLLLDDNKHTLCKLLRYQSFRNALDSHLHTIYAQENTQFYSLIENFRHEYFHTQRDRVSRAKHIFTQFLDSASESCVNVSHDERKRLAALFADDHQLSHIDNHVFDQVQEKIVDLMATSCLGEFLGSDQFLQLLPRLLTLAGYSPLVDTLAFTEPMAWFRKLPENETTLDLRLVLVLWELVRVRACLYSPAQSVSEMSDNSKEIGGSEMQVDEKHKILYTNQLFAQTLEECVGASLEQVFDISSTIHIPDPSVPYTELSLPHGTLLLKELCVSPTLQTLGIALFFPQDASFNSLNSFRKVFALWDYFLPDSQSQHSADIDDTSGIEELFRAFKPLLGYFTPKAIYSKLVLFACFRTKILKVVLEASDDYALLECWQDIQTFKSTSHPDQEMLDKKASALYKRHLYPDPKRKPLFSPQQTQTFMDMFQQPNRDNTLFDPVQSELDSLMAHKFHVYLGEKESVWIFLLHTISSLKEFTPTVQAHLRSRRALLEMDPFVHGLLALLEVLPVKSVLWEMDDTQKRVLYSSPLLKDEFIGKPLCEMVGQRKKMLQFEDRNVEYCPVDIGDDGMIAVFKTIRLLEPCSLLGIAFFISAEEFQTEFFTECLTNLSCTLSFSSFSTIPNMKDEMLPQSSSFLALDSSPPPSPF